MTKSLSIPYTHKQSISSLLYFSHSKNFQIAEATLTGPRFNTYYCQFNVFLDPNILCKQVWMRHLHIAKTPTWRDRHVNLILLNNSHVCYNIATSASGENGFLTYWVHITKPKSHSSYIWDIIFYFNTFTSYAPFCGPNLGFC